MTRRKAISEPPALVREQRRLQAESNRSNDRIYELDSQNEWLAHIAAGRIEVR